MSVLYDGNWVDREPVLLTPRPTLAKTSTLQKGRNRVLKVPLCGSASGSEVRPNR